MDYYDIIDDIINCCQLISVVLQKLENGNVKVKHLTNKGQHYSDINTTEVYLHGDTEIARMNNNAFLQKPCISPQLIVFYTLFFPCLVFSSLCDILLTILHLGKTPV